jgi:hypothetical protein
MAACCIAEPTLICRYGLNYWRYNRIIGGSNDNCTRPFDKERKTQAMSTNAITKTARKTA